MTIIPWDSPLCLAPCRHTEILVSTICLAGCLVEVLEHRYHSLFLAEGALRQ